ncbi:MAG: FAD-dependent oxidoreductase [Vicinamibacterales bacterium]
MQRDLPGLADTTFDLVVVGAGIYGTLAAWEAARRGWRVALIDRGDLGGGTSFNSLKTLHGGLRSLQSANLTQMRRFIAERRAFAIMAPHLVDPLPFCVPTYTHPTRNPWAMRIALAITDLVGRDRNDGIADPHLRLPGGRVVSRSECLGLNPVIGDREVTGGAVWFDYQMRHAERIVVAAAASAAALGAVIGTYVDAEGLTLAGGRVAALRVRDTRTDTAFDIRTRAVLNAAGPWAGALAARLAGPAATAPAPRLSRAMNLVVPRFTRDHACGGVVDGRYLFLVPWRGVSIVGTSHDPHEGGADAPCGGPSHVAALLRDAQLAFPKAGLNAASVRLVHRGLLPMTSAPDAPVALLKESAVVDHAADGCPGLVSLHSVRYTTARPPAFDAVDAVARALGEPVDASPRPALRLASASFETVDALVATARRAHTPGTTADQRERLARTYGDDWTLVARRIAATPDTGRGLAVGCEVTAAELLHVVDHEAALTLSDVLLRRTAVANTGHPGDAVVRAAIDVLAPVLGWDADRATRERAAFERVFPAAS